ncbi:hypothetical protein E2C01_084332 [Portunus trituberculatus]|uniref:Uncharacterized protein n=1 Tax=Portunus trituberculatus TaxID=210409 RepID=A0A5B7J8Y2_PORTR|nr:hypothetical protein [Portunus trituberculatus]
MWLYTSPTFTCQVSPTSLHFSRPDLTQIPLPDSSNCSLLRLHTSLILPSFSHLHTRPYLTFLASRLPVNTPFNPRN